MVKQTEEKWNNPIFHYLKIKQMHAKMPSIECTTRGKGKDVFHKEDRQPGKEARIRIIKQNAREEISGKPKAIFADFIFTWVKEEMMKSHSQ